MILDCFFLLILLVAVISVICVVNKTTNKLKNLEDEPIIFSGMCSLYIIDFSDANKVEILKQLRLLTGMSLKNALNILDSTPSLVANNLTPEVAKQYKDRLEKAGSVIEIREGS